MLDTSRTLGQVRAGCGHLAPPSGGDTLFGNGATDAAPRGAFFPGRNVKHEHKVYPAPHAQLSLIVPRTIDIYIVEQKSTRRLRDIVHAWIFQPTDLDLDRDRIIDSSFVSACGGVIMLAHGLYSRCSQMHIASHGQQRQSLNFRVETGTWGIHSIAEPMPSHICRQDATYEDTRYS
jgi:hypothetical protein